MADKVQALVDANRERNHALSELSKQYAQDFATIQRTLSGESRSMATAELNSLSQAASINIQQNYCAAVRRVFASDYGQETYE